MDHAPEEKPLDQRAREAEQYSFDFPEKRKQPPPPDTQVCIGNCKICQFCDGD